MFQTKVAEKIKTHILHSITSCFSENCAVGEIIWKNMVEPYRPEIIQCSACALHVGSLRLHTHTHKIYNTCWFSITTIVMETCLIVTLHIHCVYLIWNANNGNCALRPFPYTNNAITIIYQSFIVHFQSAKHVDVLVLTAQTPLNSVPSPCLLFA
jgi:hypothetical protein